jgi:hypothetical protein
MQNSHHLPSQADANSNQQPTSVKLSNFASHTPDAQGDVNQSYSAAPVIDPSLDTTTNASVVGPAEDEDAERKYVNGDGDNINGLSLKITQAAMEAVLGSVRHEAGLTPGTPRETDLQDSVDSHEMGYDSIPQPRDADGVVDADEEADAGEEEGCALATSLINGRDGTRVYQTPLDTGRPKPMEHMLTEDGEPMLNPG